MLRINVRDVIFTSDFFKNLLIQIKMSKRKQNSLVSSKLQLSKDDSTKLSMLTIRPGKLASGRKKTTSGVWRYFGRLYQLKGPSSNEDMPSTSTGYVVLLRTSILLG